MKNGLIKRVWIAFAIGAAVTALVWMTAACSSEQVSERPAATEPAGEIGDDAYSCTLTDASSGRELACVSVGGQNRFYLPGSVELDKLTLNCYIGSHYSMTLDGVTYTETVHLPVDATQTDRIKITFNHRDGTSLTETYAFYPSSANILYLDIDESLGTVDAMQGDKAHETYCYGRLTYFDTNGQYDLTSAFSIKGRGNATWEDEKKGYALKLYESDGYSEKNKVALSGMGKSSDWVLIANHRDRTLIRNALALTLAEKLGMENAVEFEFVDLYLCGEYMGLYMLTEKIESGEDQIDIKEANADNLDGGYLLEFDNYSDTPQIKLKSSGLRVTVKSPSDLPSYTAIEQLLNETENALNSRGGYNRRTGKHWTDYIDLESFAILWMVREYAMDYDANVNFRFYYDPSDGKLHGGPAWDFDNSMARSKGIYADPEFALIESGERNQNCWLTTLMEYDLFREEICRLYNEHIELFRTNDRRSIYALANRYYEGLSYSIGQNFTVWKHQLANKSWNTPKNMTYDGHFEILTDFLEGRNLFWSKYIPELVE